MINRMKINAVEIKSSLDELARAALCSALKVLFSETEKKLFVRAEHSTNTADKNKILDQIHHLKRTAEQFEHGFLSQISQMQASATNDWYRLYKNRALAIQIEDMIGQARAKFGIELAQYESRINWLNKNHPEQIPENLYTLPALVAAYLTHTALFDSVTQENLIRSLGHQFLNKLEPMYILMNDLLIQNGALPEIKSLRKGGSSALDNLLEEMALSEASLSEELTLSSTMTKSDVLQNLQKMIIDGEQLLPKKSAWSSEAFYHAVIKHIGTAKPFTELAPKETETVMLTGTIISGMLNDRLINPLIKTQIAQLQTTILYSALFDEGFFSQSKHPARTLLNKLAIIGSDPAQNSEILKKIPPIIEDFLANSAQSTPPNFELLLQAITKIDQEQFRSVSKSDENPSSQAQTLIARSQQRVSDLLRQEVNNQALHPISRQFIEQILAPFLVHILMAHGRQCSEWMQGLNLLQELIEADNRPGSAKKILATISHVYELVDYPFFHTEGISVDVFGNAIAQIVEHLESVRSRISAETLSDSARKNLSAENLTAAQSVVAPAVTTKDETPQITAKTSAAAVGTAKITQRTESPPIPAVSVKVNPAPTASPPPTTAPAPEAGTIAKASADRFSLSAMADPQTRAFMQRFVLNGEWLQIFTADGAALRRLKAHQINQDLGTINFSNRNGEIVLVLPLIQFFEDIVDGRSHPVFDNVAFNNALTQLVGSLNAAQA